MKGLFLLSSETYDKIYGPEERRQIEQMVDIYAPPQTKETIAKDASILGEADVILSGWGCPVLTEELLAAALRLKAVFYGAGSIRAIVTEAFWARQILITTAYEANDIPVSEFTLAQILLSLKGYWHYVHDFGRTGRWYEHLDTAGVYGSTVGLISLGMIGKMVAERLKTFPVQVIAYDPYTTAETAARLNLELCSLEDVFRRADVVSLHTPWLPETEGMIRREHFAAMKPGATFVNTARGAIVREDEMAEVLRERPDLYALLDVTHPEPPPPTSPLLSLPNIVITPHIAGANTNECKRNGQYVVEELRRFLRGEPLRYAVSRERAALMA